MSKEQDEVRKPVHKFGFFGWLMRFAQRLEWIENKEFELTLREKQLKVIALELMLKDHYNHLKVIDYLYSTAVK